MYVNSTCSKSLFKMYISVVNIGGVRTERFSTAETALIQIRSGFFHSFLAFSQENDATHEWRQTNNSLK